MRETLCRRLVLRLAMPAGMAGSLVISAIPWAVHAADAPGLRPSGGASESSPSSGGNSQGSGVNASGTGMGPAVGIPPVLPGTGGAGGGGAGAAAGGALGIATDAIELPSVRYYVVNQTVPVVLTELAYLAKLNIAIEGLFESRVQNYLARGPLVDVLDDLGRLHGFVWHIDNTMLEIAPIRSVLSRTIKVENMDEERLRELIAASGLKILRDGVSYDASTGVLRLKGAPKFVAKAEAAVLVAIRPSGEDTINVIRYGRSTRTSQPAGLNSIRP